MQCGARTAAPLLGLPVAAVAARRIVSRSSTLAAHHPSQRPPVLTPSAQQTAGRSAPLDSCITQRSGQASSGSRAAGFVTGPVTWFKRCPSTQYPTLRCLLTSESTPLASLTGVAACGNTASLALQLRPAVATQWCVKTLACVLPVGCI